MKKQIPQNSKSFFKGWYFKHQNESETIAIIPGYCKDHAFIQVLTNHGVYQYIYPIIEVRNHAIYVGNCIFSRYGIELHLPDIEGCLEYGPFHPLSHNIMGPFRFLPMECKHGIISMHHAVSGTLTLSGKKYDISNGTGYIESDCGTSFPSEYLWMQCNEFRFPCSIMLAIAKIPLGNIHFTGCICAITCQQKEYVLATYHGARILAATKNHVRICQGSLLLEIDMQEKGKHFPLRSPKLGQMSETIQESCDCNVQIRLWDHKQKIFALKSNRASFECVSL